MTETERDGKNKNVYVKHVYIYNLPTKHIPHRAPNFSMSHSVVICEREKTHIYFVLQVFSVRIISPLTSREAHTNRANNTYDVCLVLMIFGYIYIVKNKKCRHAIIE